MTVATERKIEPNEEQMSILSQMYELLFSRPLQDEPGLSIEINSTDTARQEVDDIGEVEGELTVVQFSVKHPNLEGPTLDFQAEMFKHDLAVLCGDIQVHTVLSQKCMTGVIERCRAVHNITQDNNSTLIQLIDYHAVPI